MVTNHPSMTVAEESNLAIGPRVPWTTGRIQGTPDPPLPYSIERVFPQLKFTKPTVLTNAPGTDRLFVAELLGKIYSFPNRPEVSQPDLFVDLGEHLPGEKQVFGLTFHPQFAQNHYCYVCYVVPGQPEGTRVSRFKVHDTNPPRIDTSTEHVLLTWPSGGHNGGCLKFGPDGYLYITTGDSGSPSPPDPKIAGQDLSNLLSSILRIDVDHNENGKAYAIPTDNPFVNLSGARGEVWCYGLRNPWKISFDILTGDLWVGDVGWDLWEMIYRVVRGANYGWSLMEGPQPVRPDGERGPTPILPPTVVHSHSESRSVTGGSVYRGSRLPELIGTYVYGDFVTGKVWGALHDGREPVRVTELVDTPLQIICFGVDNKNELMVVDFEGTIHRFVPSAASEANRDFPRKLSDTGIFQDVAGHRVMQGVISYRINAEPWADHTTAERYLALPETTQIGVAESKNKTEKDYLQLPWQFPNDAILMKTVSLEMEFNNPDTRRRLETQILHQYSGQWRAYNYLWNDEQTDAVLADDVAQDMTFQVIDPRVPGGKREQTYHFASRSECMLCHTKVGGSINGFRIEQLNRHHSYGDVEANQLEAMSQLGLFAEPLPVDPPRWSSVADSGTDLNDRARTYLHVNCAHCHRPGGGGLATMDVRFTVPLESTNLLGSRPAQGTFSLSAAKVLVPGDPYRSLLFYRMATSGRGHMPKFGSSLVDEQGMLLIKDWIDQQKPVLPEQSTPDFIQCQRSAQQKQLALLRAASSSSADQQAAIEKLLSDVSGGLLLASSLNSNPFPMPTHQRILKQVAAVSQLEVRDEPTS